jgi:hypothetical protein
MEIASTSAENAETSAAQAHNPRVMRRSRNNRLIRAMIRE